MTSELTESVDNTLTDTVTFTYTQSSGMFDEYIFTLTNGDKPPVSHTTIVNTFRINRRDLTEISQNIAKLSKQSLVFIHLGLLLACHFDFTRELMVRSML